MNFFKHIFFFFLLGIVLINDSAYGAEKSFLDTLLSKKVQNDEDKKKAVGIFDNLPWNISIMFTKKELNQIYNAYEAADRGDLGEFPVDNTARKIDNVINNQNIESTKSVFQPPSEDDNPSYNAQYFFLGSIIYYSPEDWSMWLNKNRIRNGEQIHNLKIVNINSTEAEFIWHTTNLDVIAPGWKSKMVRIDNVNSMILNGEKDDINLRKIKAFDKGDFNWDYISKNKKIQIDSVIGAIKFKLALRQAFTTWNMEIAEGLAAPLERVKFVESQNAAIDSGNMSGVVENGGAAPDYDTLVGELFE